MTAWSSDRAGPNSTVVSAAGATAARPCSASHGLLPDTSTIPAGSKRSVTGTKSCTSGMAGR